MIDADTAIALVRKAICSGVSGCFEWESEDVQRRVLGDQNLSGITLRELKRITFDYVAGGGLIRQFKQPDGWEQEFNYQMWFPVDGLPRDLFVKVILTDEDVDCPAVAIVSVHLETHSLGK